MTTTSSFWSEKGLEPKRKFRYLVYFAGMPQWIAKTVTKPSFSVGTTQHSYLQHNFNFPGRVTWQDVNLTIVDAITPDSVATLYRIIQESGYVLPPNVSQNELGGKRTITKEAMVNALGTSVQIETIGGSGDTEILESWVLNNPQITSVNFDTLDYSSDDLLNIQITLKYDWASLNEGLSDESLPTLWPYGNAPTE